MNAGAEAGLYLTGGQLPNGPASTRAMNFCHYNYLQGFPKKRGLGCVMWRARQTENTTRDLRGLRGTSDLLLDKFVFILGYVNVCKMPGHSQKFPPPPALEFFTQLTAWLRRR